MQDLLSPDGGGGGANPEGANPEEEEAPGEPLPGFDPPPPGGAGDGDIEEDEEEEEAPGEPLPGFDPPAGGGAPPGTPSPNGVGRITPSSSRTSGCSCRASGAPGSSTTETPCGQSSGAMAM